jgi:hypothetical protein
MDEDLERLFTSVEKIEEPNKKFIDKKSAEKVVTARETDTFTREFRAACATARAVMKGTHSARAVLRGTSDKTWVDSSLSEWPENDYRIHVRDLPADATDQDLAEAFQRYRSFAKAKVIFDSSGRNRRYGFVSLLDVNDYIDAMKTMNNAFIKSRRVTLLPSKWKDKNLRNAM